MFPHGNATHSNLRLRDAHDAHVLFQAVRQGILPLIRKRLTGPEQQALHAGQVFVWADREGSLERWTDGHNWSPSRVRGPFLMYDEMPEDTEAFLRRKQQKNGERRVKQPRKKRLPPLPGGLSKQTYSATLIQNGIDIQKWHLTAYFKDDGSNDLLIIDDDPDLSSIIVPENTFKSSMSRKSKGSSSRRRDSMSEHRSAYDDNESDDREPRESPIDEYPNASPTRPSAGHAFPSPPLIPTPLEFAPSSAWDNYQGFNLVPRSGTSSFSSTDDNRGGSGSGSSNGSAASTGTVHGLANLNDPSSARSFNFQPQQLPYQPQSLAPSANMNRGRPMHLEGIHSRFDAPINFPGFNPQVPYNSSFVVPPRSISLGGLPDSRSNYFPQDVNVKPDPTLDDRRGSYMSIGSSRSTSSQSTSASSKLQTSSNSSPASSWSQQSPHLNPAVVPNTSNNPQWSLPSASGIYNPQHSRVKIEHMGSPLGASPIVPSAVPSAQAGASPSTYRPTYTPPAPPLAGHPELVQTAVPPHMFPSRRATVPATLTNEAVNSNPNWPSPYATSPFQSLPSPFADVSAASGGTIPSGLPESCAFRLPPAVESFDATKVSAGDLHQPRAVTATGIPGSWEASESQSFNFSAPFGDMPFTNAPEQLGAYGNVGAVSTGQFSIPGPGEVFESVVPSGSQAAGGQRPGDFHPQQPWQT
ncbi:hypothetical protein FRB99_000439 [Tulasnella sp. 403]|nr:hypothetical protein FRB99_000439 [Tulasnella sp. 403]